MIYKSHHALNFFEYAGFPYVRPDYKYKIK